MFTEKENNLANEAHLTSSLLGNGLTSLRNASLNDKGLYYQAFFSLSIGIERLLKIIIISQHRVTHNAEFPSGSELKKLGHDLLLLYERAKITIQKKSIHYKLINFLNDFAKKARYYNIDNMLDPNNSKEDPLAQWADITQEIYDSVEKKKYFKNKEELASLMDEFSVTSFMGLRGNHINSWLGILNESEKTPVIQSYSTQYMVEIIKQLVEIIEELETLDNLLPVLTEFFPLFYYDLTPSEIRKKRKWTRN